MVIRKAIGSYPGMSPTSGSLPATCRAFTGMYDLLPSGISPWVTDVVGSQNTALDDVMLVLRWSSGMNNLL
jgi:hypothetical protein